MGAWYRATLPFPRRFCKRIRKGAPLLGTEGDQVKALQDLQANHGVQGGLPTGPPSWATFRARLAGTSTTSPSRLAK